MPRPTTRAALAVAGALFAIGLFGASIVQASTPGTPIVTTIEDPRGLTPLPGGELLVSAGSTGRVWLVEADGTVKAIIAGLPVASTTSIGPLGTEGVSAAVPDGMGGYRAVIGGDAGAQYSVSSGGVTNELVDLAAYEQANNTDGVKDANGDPVLNSSPYDVVVDAVGRTYVTDTGANAVLRYSGGNTNTYFVFQKISNPVFPVNGTATIEQWPTGITIGPDDAIYVSTFTAPPYPVGEARVYRLEDKNGDGDARDTGEWSVFATGLSAATDLAFDANGRLWVSEFSTNMSVNSLGRVSRITNGVPTGVVFSILEPTSLTFMDDGRMIVSQESIGRVADISGISGGGFSPATSSSISLTIYGGGPVDQLNLEAAGLGATAVAITVSGKMVILVPGAPAFVNQAFSNAFPGGISAGTAMIVVRP